MNSIRQLASCTLFAAAATSWAVPAASQDKPSPSEQARAASARADEYLELLRSSNSVQRFVGLQQGLKDENIGVRSMVLGAYLKSITVMNVEVAIQPGGRFTAADVPNLEIKQITWNADGRTFSGSIISWGFGHHAMAQIIGDRLVISYPRLGMPNRIAPPEAGPSKEGTIIRTCRAVLLPNKTYDGMIGTLTCEGLQLSLPVSLDFG